MTRDESSDFRDRPGFQFGAAVVLSIVLGAAIGLAAARVGREDIPELLLWAPFAALFSWLFSKYEYRPLPEPGQYAYSHPILGAWAGIAATVGVLVLGGSLTRAMLLGLGVGIIYAILQVSSWRKLIRNDPPGFRRPIPTVTGYREAP